MNATEKVAGLDVMLTPDDVAALLQVSKSTLCRMTKRDEIPHRRLSKQVVRYSRNEIEAWLKGEDKR